MNRQIALAMDAAAYAAVAANPDALLAELARNGIIFDRALGKVGFLHAPARDVRLKGPIENLSYDAQPELVLTNNAGIPAWLVNYMDPQIIQILTSPNKAAQIIGGETQYGDWTTKTATFTTVQHTGEVSAYGDFNTNGMANAVSNFPQRQSFAYQINTQYGELELAMWANARINLANEKNAAGMTAMANYQNLTYFFGVSNLQNYGLLNDASLSPAIVSPKKWNASGTSAEEVYEYVRRLYIQIQYQSGGTIDEQSPICLAMSPVLSLALHKTNIYNVNVYDQLKKNFPNIRFETAPQYANVTGGELVQMIVESVNGVKTVTAGFTEKMRAHAVVVAASSWSQKKSGGSFGTIIKNYTAIAQMIGC
jgi:hypothetical protein